MAKLEDVLKASGYTDADLTALEPMLKDARFRGALETQFSNLEGERDKFRQEDEEWNKWHQDTALPALQTHMDQAEKARMEAASLREQLRVAQERGLVAVAHQDEPATKVTPAAGEGTFDPKKLGLITKTDLDGTVLQFAELEGDAIALAQDISAEYVELFGKPLHYADSEGRTGFRALRKEALAQKKPVDQYIREKFKFAERRAEIAAKAAADHDAQIRLDERNKVIAEQVNPMLRAPSSSQYAGIHRPEGVEQGRQPWDNNDRSNARVEKAVKSILQKQAS